MMKTKLTVRNLRARPVMVPFRRPPVAASGTMPACALVLIDLETEEGITGRAYVFGFMPWTLAPIAGTIAGMQEMIKGDAVAPLTLDARLRKRLTLFGTPGIAGIALAGIDMCAWDALAQAAGLPLLNFLGGELRRVRAYNSNGL